jgi:hypothetical protein
MAERVIDLGPLHAMSFEKIVAAVIDSGLPVRRNIHIGAIQRPN